MTASLELTTHSEVLYLPADIHTHLTVLIPCLASTTDDRLSAWIFAPASPVRPGTRSNIVYAILALYLDSETRSDAALIVKLPFISSQSVGRPIFGPAALKLGALTNRAPSKCAVDKVEACRRSYHWMCLKAEMVGEGFMWMPFEPVYDELTAEEKNVLDVNDKILAARRKHEAKMSPANHLYYELLPESIQP